MITKLKKITDIFAPDSPTYLKLKVTLEEWRTEYDTPTKDYGDKCIINFINSFLEVESN